MIDWPENDDDFLAVVNTAMRDHRSELASRMRDALGRPEVVARTVEALEAILESIEAQLDESWSEDHLARTTRARDGMFDRLVWYRTVASMGADDG